MKSKRRPPLRAEELEPRRMLAAVCSAGRDDWTVGLTACTSDASEGYTLVTPNGTSDAYILDIHGRTVHSWTGGPYDNAGGSRFAAYLAPDGSLVSTGVTPDTAINGLGGAGAIWVQDWDGNLTWNWKYSTDDFRLHHDIELLPNGNILAFAWVRESAATVVAAGRDPAGVPAEGVLWTEQVMEIKRTGLTTGSIVWEWDVSDHLVQDFDATKANFGSVSGSPQLVDINYATAAGVDWLHFNGIAYNSDLDQIALSAHRFNEIWVIDHSTTTAEAAGHSGGDSGAGGDLLYRWGNPEAYDRGTSNDRQIGSQHDVQWIGAGLPGVGNMLIYNNRGFGPVTSQLVEIATPVDANGDYTLTGTNAYGPSAPAWSHETGVASPVMSSIQRLSNGNTLASYALLGVIEEFDTNGNSVWHYTNPDSGAVSATQGDQSAEAGPLFRSRRYEPTYAAFVGRSLTPNGYVEDWVVGDYDLSGALDAGDVDALCQGIDSGDMIYDVNFDGVLDGSDVATLVTAMGFKLGDANLDGKVDNVDFGIWKTNRFSTNHDWSAADFNHDGFVDVSDFNIWNANRDSAVAALAAVVPVSNTDSLRPVWQNAEDVHDVNDDGVVSPLDALVLINELNARARLAAANVSLPSSRPDGAFFLDVTGDGDLTPLDSLAVINRFNSASVDVAFGSDWSDGEDDEDDDA